MTYTTMTVDVQSKRKHRQYEWQLRLCLLHTRRTDDSKSTSHVLRHCSIYHINLKYAAGQVDHATNQLNEVEAAEKCFRFIKKATQNTATENECEREEKKAFG